jgi:HEAT repeats
VKSSRIMGLTVVGMLAFSGATAQAGGHWGTGVNIGFPGYWGGGPWYPYYGYGYPYYYPPPYYPVYAAPPPPVVVQPPAVRTSSAEPPVYATSAPVVTRAASPGPQNGEVERDLQALADPNEQVRIESVLQLGRLSAQQAIDPIAATLAGDHSPSVREAAARALGLIGSPRGMPALQRAAQMDPDRDVRHSAEFALEVVQARR